MAAAYATFRFALPGGRVKSFNGYASDASNVLIKFDEAKVAAAGSNDNIQFPNGATLIDVCFTSDLATPTNVQLLVNGTPTGDILDVTAHLTTVVNRPNPMCPVPAGARFQAMQIA